MHYHFLVVRSGVLSKLNDVLHTQIKLLKAFSSSSAALCIIWITSSMFHVNFKLQYTCILEAENENRSKDTVNPTQTIQDVLTTAYQTYKVSFCHEINTSSQHL